MLTGRKYDLQSHITASRMAVATNGIRVGLSKYISTAASTAMIGNCNAAKRDWVISGKIRE
jgi:hypothetical protein